MSLFFNAPLPFIAGGAGGDPVEFTYRGFVSDTSNGPNYTFTVPSGVPSNCLMIVAAGHEDCGEILSLTGGGYTWTLVARSGRTGTASNGDECAIFAAEITTPPSSVTLNNDNGGLRANASFYSIINHSSATPVSTDGNNSSNVTTRTATLNNLQGGDVMIAYTLQAEPGVITYSGLTRDFNDTTTENNSTFSSGSDYKTAGSNSQTITTTFDGGNDFMCIAAAAWR